MEKAIEEKKNQLWGTGAQNHWDPDEDHETVWDDEESLTEQNEHLDDGDLEYINDILNSFSRPMYNHGNSRNLTLESLTPEDALARAFASQKTPQKFNLKFNQNSTTRGSEEDQFSYFSNVEEDETSELGDYFSDDEEDDTWDREDRTSENYPWSHTDFNDSESNFTQSQTTLSEWDPVISGLETINEARFEDDSEADKLNHISGFFIIRANNEALYTHLDEVSERIEENIKQLEKRFSRSPRAIKAMQALEAAIAMFDRTHPEPEYQISEYATGKRRWERAPRVHPIEITELLNYEAQKKHHENKILGTQWHKFSSRTLINRQNRRRISDPFGETQEG